MLETIQHGITQHETAQQCGFHTVNAETSSIHMNNMGAGESGMSESGVRVDMRVGRGAISVGGGITVALPIIRRTKIINTGATDFVQQLFVKEQITPEQWQLVRDIRRLALHARRSQGIRAHLQSHSQYWGMPHICSQDTYVNARAEQKWKLFLFYLKPFTEHQWLDSQMLELLFHGGQVICAHKSERGKTGVVPGGVAGVAPGIVHGIVPVGTPSEEREKSDLSQVGFTLEAVQNALLVIEYVYEKTYRRRR